MDPGHLLRPFESVTPPVGDATNAPVRKIVERLQHQRLEDHHFVPWLAPRRTLARRLARAKLANKRSHGTIAAIATSGSFLASRPSSGSDRKNPIAPRRTLQALKSRQI